MEKKNWIKKNSMNIEHILYYIRKMHIDRGSALDTGKKSEWAPSWKTYRMNSLKRIVRERKSERVSVSVCLFVCATLEWVCANTISRKMFADFHHIARPNVTYTLVRATQCTCILHLHVSFTRFALSTIKTMDLLIVKEKLSKSFYVCLWQRLLVGRPSSIKQRQQKQQLQKWNDWKRQYSNRKLLT